ncbi:membrane-associated proteins in eicosanoid and glutathione metabolism [Xylaria sp. FL1777]|nr:membrane-associated proteins in eicosanoid and glutathione metabolism [Xylaria sp. FL1777]
MSYVFEVPKEYGYVLAVATSSIFINTVHKTLTSMKRKASGIPYPISYATKEEVEKNPKAYNFNLAQRAHTNFTENFAPFITALLIAGLRYPNPATWAGCAWVAGRLAYAIGYTNYGPSGRILGYGISQAGKISLTIMAVLTCWNLVGAA